MKGTTERNYITVDRVYFSIGEASQILGVAISRIRCWLKWFEIKVKMDHGGNLRFTASNLNRLFEIKRLLQMDSVKGVKEKFNERDQKDRLPYRTTPTSRSIG